MEEKNYKNLDKKLQLLINDIVKYSEVIPSGDIYGLSQKMKMSARLVSPCLKSLYQKSKRIDRIRSVIETNAYLEECKNYLSLSKTLRYGDTDSLVERVDDISVLVHLNAQILNKVNSTIQN